MSSLAREGRRGFLKRPRLAKNRELRLLQLITNPYATRSSGNNMKKFNIINNIVDTEVFQKEFMADIPQATFSEKNGENFIYVDDKFENEVENYLKKKCVRFIPMTEKQIEYEGYNVTVSEDSSFYYIDFNSGAGEAVYEKADWTLDDALKDQLNLDKE